VRRARSAGALLSIGGDTRQTQNANVFVAQSKLK
jgi:hypothetical protein